MPHRVATAHLVLALCYWQTQQESKALSAWGTALPAIQDRFLRGLVQGNNASGFWFDWVFARVLLQEAEELIHSQRDSAPGVAP